MNIELRHLRKTFGNFVALDDLSLSIGTGELVALLGLSGSGKTTLLRIIGGLERPDSGQVLFDGEEATLRNPRVRQVGFVFQHYALFRHMSVFENIAFGMRVRPRKVRPSEAEIHERVHRLLKLIQLEWIAGRFPAQLSGGQRQRVALARALVVEPRVLLLDEPFGALDAKVRGELRRWLARLHQELQITTVFVTHDQEEALELGNRVVLMNQGRIEQVGTPEDVYHNPATPFVYEFLGNVNLFHGRLENGALVIANDKAHSNGSSNGAQGHQPAALYVRPHLLEVSLTRREAPSFAAAVTHINAAGPMVKLELLSEWGDPVWVELGHEKFSQLNLARGVRVYLYPKEIRGFIPRN